MFPVQAKADFIITEGSAFKQPPPAAAGLGNCIEKKKLQFAEIP